MFSISYLTHIGNIVEFWPNRFYVHDLNKVKSIVFGGILDPMNSFYKFCDTTRPNIESTALISHTG
jgi:hypothetical protein